MSWAAGSSLNVGAGSGPLLPSSQIVPCSGTVALQGRAVPCPLSQLHPSLLSCGDTKSHLLTALVIARP